MQDYDLIAEIYNEFEMGNFSRLMVPHIRDICRKLKINYKSVLDLACGTGEALLLWSKLGRDIAGVDGCSRMLNQAREKLRSSKPILLKNQELANLKLKGCFDLTTCLYDTVNHLLKKTELRSLFRNASQLTADDGIFIFDINTIYGFIKRWKNRTIIRESEKYYSAWKSDYDDRKKLAQIQITLFTKKRNNLYNRRECTVMERGYTIAELRTILKQSGFRKVDTFKCFTLTRPSRSTGRVIFACRKV